MTLGTQTIKCQACPKKLSNSPDLLCVGGLGNRPGPPAVVPPRPRAPPPKPTGNQQAEPAAEAPQSPAAPPAKLHGTHLPQHTQQQAQPMPKPQLDVSNTTSKSSVLRIACLLACRYTCLPMLGVGATTAGSWRRKAAGLLTARSKAATPPGSLGLQVNLGAHARRFNFKRALEGGSAGLYLIVRVTGITLTQLDP